MFQLKSLLLAVTVATLATVRTFDIEPRISHGKNANSGQFPFYVHLEVNLGPKGYSICGGSLISKQWVVTSAGCLDDSIGVNVHLGSLRPANVTEEGRVIVKVSKSEIFRHPKYFRHLIYK